MLIYFLLFQRRESVESEVRGLRDHISDLKIQISTITKGIPMSKIELREEKKPPTSSESGRASPSKQPPNPAFASIQPAQKPSLAYLKSQQASATKILNPVAPV